MMHQPIHALRPREPRRKVRIPVRMRAGGSWADMCMLDISSRGLSMPGCNPPALGSYIEVRRGSHVIIAQVVWRSAGRVGARTQDPVPVEAFANTRANTGVVAPAKSMSFGPERRADVRLPTPAEMHERSRLIGRLIEFSFLLAATASLAILCGGVAMTAIAEPLTIVTTALR